MVFSCLLLWGSSCSFIQIIGDGMIFGAIKIDVFCLLEQEHPFYSLP